MTLAPFTNHPNNDRVMGAFLGHFLHFSYFLIDDKSQECSRIFDHKLLTHAF